MSQEVFKNEKYNHISFQRII